MHNLLSVIEEWWIDKQQDHEMESSNMIQGIQNL